MTEDLKNRTCETCACMWKAEPPRVPTAAQLADFAGVSRDRAHGLLAKLERRGVIYRWKRPGTRAALWVAKT